MQARLFEPFLSTSPGWISLAVGPTEFPTFVPPAPPVNMDDDGGTGAMHHFHIDVHLAGRFELQQAILENVVDFYALGSLSGNGWATARLTVSGLSEKVADGENGDTLELTDFQKMLVPCHNAISLAFQGALEDPVICRVGFDCIDSLPWPHKVGDG